MSESAKPKPEQSANKLRRSVFTLSFANAVEMAIQVALPIALVRLLTEGDFGLYRTLWLIAFTCSGTLAFGMPASLLYFLPRSEKGRARQYMAQVALFMFAVGLLAAAGTAFFVLNHETGQGLGLMAAPFVGLWVFASLLDFVFNAQQAVSSQARTNLSFALLRVLLVLGAALVFRDWTAVMIAQLVLVVTKASVCAYNVARYTRPFERPTVDTLSEQARYSLPFGISTTLYLLRSRIDQWMVASLFSVAQFGMYSIASVFTPIQSLIRMTVNQVVLPEMSRMQAQSDNSQMMALSRRCNIAIGLLMFPILAFIAVWAESILSFLFTNRYSGVAPILRVYLVVMLLESIEIAWMLMAMRQGRFMMIVDAIALPVSIAVAALGAVTLGLVGAAAGGIAGALVAQVSLYRRCAQQTGIAVRNLQDWATLGRIALASMLSGGVSLGVLLLPLPEYAIVKLLLAGLLFCATYLLALRLLGVSRHIRAVLGDRLAGLVGY